jgi:DNA-binding XRE family transcriptional regulator
VAADFHHSSKGDEIGASKDTECSCSGRVVGCTCWNDWSVGDRDEWIRALPGIVERERRKAMLTQAEFAVALDVPTESVEDWEAGESLPTLPEFFRLAEFFGWPIPRLIVEEGLTDR